MNLSKSHDFFAPEQVRGRIHIIGCGAVGSTIAENLVHLGCTKITIWDFDTVEAKNVANQMFREIDIGKKKVDALAEMLHDINPLIDKDLKIEPDGWHGQPLSGYVFLAVDNIDLRREIVEKNERNPNIKAMFDFRMRLTDAQHYAADWADPRHIDVLHRTMEFSHEEAATATPRSACNIELNVVTTVRVIVGLGVHNFMEFVRSNGEKLWTSIQLDLSTFAVERYRAYCEI